MVYGVDETTGDPGKRKAVGGGVTKDYADYTAQTKADEAKANHELNPDPHPQYTTDAEVLALIPPQRFVTFWKWS